MAAKNSTSDKDTTYEEELELLNNEEEELEDQEKSLSDVLRTLNKSLATMATSMVAMERSVKRSAPIETSDSESSLAKKRKKQATKRIEDDGQGTSSEDSDSETLRKTTKQPPADSAIEEETGNTDARLEQDDLLSEISQDFAQADDVGPNINQQLADIITKRGSSKLNDAKQKEKLDKYSRPENCDNLIVPRVNAEIWDKIDQKARQQDLRVSTIQKFIAKVGSILAMATDSLLKMRNDTSVPDIDQLVTMNTDALALLGHTMCELSIRRREAIRPHLHKDYASLCASHVPVTTELFGDDLQSRLNNIRASNKISRTTVLDRSATRDRTSASWSNNSRQKGNHFLSKGHRWKHNPPKMTFQSRKDTRSKQGQWKAKQQS